MLLTNLWQWATGYLSVEIKGDNLVRFINHAHRRGIILRDIQLTGNSEGKIKILPRSFFALRKVVRSSKVKLKIRHKRGLPFLTKRVWNRKGALIGAVTGICIIWLLSSFIWFVDVEGNKKLSASQIKSEAASLGIKPGVLLSRVDPNDLARGLKERISQAAWVGVTNQGTRVLIQVVEKVEKPLQSEGKGSMIASKSGLVTDVLVLKGTAQVKEGQMVKVGQPLINGDTHPAAQGFVRARVWYTGSASLKLAENGFRFTGKTYIGKRMKISSKVIILTDKKQPFDLYDEEISTSSVPKWRNISLPVEIITVTYREKEQYSRVLSKDEGLKIAEGNARDNLLAKLPEGAKIIKERIYRSNEYDENTIGLNIDAEILEEIAVHERF